MRVESAGDLRSRIRNSGEEFVHARQNVTDFKLPCRREQRNDTNLPAIDVVWRDCVSIQHEQHGSTNSGRSQLSRRRRDQTVHLPGNLERPAARIGMSMPPMSSPPAMVTVLASAMSVMPG